MANVLKKSLFLLLFLFVIFLGISVPKAFALLVWTTGSSSPITADPSWGNTCLCAFDTTVQPQPCLCTDNNYQNPQCRQTVPTSDLTLCQKSNAPAWNNICCTGSGGCANTNDPNGGNLPQWSYTFVTGCSGTPAGFAGCDVSYTYASQTCALTDTCYDPAQGPPGYFNAQICNQSCTGQTSCTVQQACLTGGVYKVCCNSNGTPSTNKCSGGLNTGVCTSPSFPVVCGVDQATCDNVIANGGKCTTTPCGSGLTIGVAACAGPATPPPTPGPGPKYTCAGGTCNRNDAATTNFYTEPTCQGQCNKCPTTGGWTGEACQAGSANVPAPCSTSNACGKCSVKGCIQYSGSLYCWYNSGACYTDPQFCGKTNCPTCLPGLQTITCAQSLDCPVPNP